MASREIVLGIETSCDETSAAIVKEGRDLLSCVTASQVETHRAYGGVVPEIASRRHVEELIPVVHQALGQSGVGPSDVSAVAVTSGPGLVGALLVGISGAKGLAYALGIPLVSVNHIEGHVYANFLAHPDLEPPVICLTVSGGHTEIALMRDHGDYVVMGRTRDDAAGEAFDKVARAMGLPYPGGPAVEKLALKGSPLIEFPRPTVGSNPMDMSFSGLKTSVLRYIKMSENDDVGLAHIAASFQKAVVDTLVSRAEAAFRATGVRVLALSGGVAANAALREALTLKGEESGFKVVYPPVWLCADNAAMIASAGYYRLKRGQTALLSVNADPGARFG